jgi:hypothetical protein
MTARYWSTGERSAADAIQRRRGRSFTRRQWAGDALPSARYFISDISNDRHPEVRPALAPELYWSPSATISNAKGPLIVVG